MTDFARHADEAIAIADSGANGHPVPSARADVLAAIGELADLIELRDELAAALRGLLGVYDSPDPWESDADRVAVERAREVLARTPGGGGSG